MSPGTPPRNSTRASTPNRSAKRKASELASLRAATKNAQEFMRTYRKKWYNLRRRARNAATLENKNRYRLMANQLSSNYKALLVSMGRSWRETKSNFR